MNHIQCSINKQVFSFLLSKTYKSDDIEIAKISSVDFKKIEWNLNINWTEENAYKIICDSLKPPEKEDKDDKNVLTRKEKMQMINTEVEEIVNEFVQYTLEWLSSNNVEQFRMKNADKGNFAD